MNIFYSEKFLEHDTGWGHPECAMRLQVITEYLKDSELDFKLVEPKPASQEVLSLVHDPRYLDQVKHPKLIKKYFPDDPINEKTYGIARLAAGAACDAAHACLKEGFAFAMVRPPGHHAGKDYFGGFCYLNNVAVAVASLLKEGKAGKVLVADFDIHHGNGTQDVFKSDGRVFYLSTHQNARTLYPYKGFESENTKTIRNVEMELGVRDGEFLKKFCENFKDAVDVHKPDVVAVSAGFDSFYKDDCCGQLTRIKETETYRKVGQMIKSAGKPVFACLEGGYFLDALGESVFKFLSAFQ